MYQIVVFLHVDNTNLIALNNSKKSVVEIVAHVQLLLDTWQIVLNFTRGELKLSMCY